MCLLISNRCVRYSETGKTMSIGQYCLMDCEDRPATLCARPTITGNRAEAGLRWRRGGESNPRVKVLQTSALPLDYAPRGHFQYTMTSAPTAHGAASLRYTPTQTRAAKNTATLDRLPG
jgi:hypothetical protein